MELHEVDVQALHVIEELSMAVTVSFAFKAALQLRIPDILAAAGPGALLTPQLIADKLPRKTANSARKLRRILHHLAFRGVFAESDSPTSTDSETEPRYGLTNVSRYLVTGGELDLKPFALLSQKASDNAHLDHLREMVEEDANPYQLAYGVDDFWGRASANPELRARFNTAMWSWSKVHNSVIAHHYDGFKDVKCLVDVGGGVGGALALIVAANPHIRGINLDQPQVVSTAPEIPGVTHVGGNFLESVPSGDAILVQHVLLDWGDDDCIKILKNCYRALPENGKVLIQENVIDLARNSASKTAAAFNMDLVMMVSFKGEGGERTRAEYKRLINAAGFSHVSFLSVRGLDLIENMTPEIYTSSIILYFPT